MLEEPKAEIAHQGGGPPKFGEHFDEILVEFGFGEDEIAELKQQKVV